ncbi:MAG: hypothetical protein EBZ78_04095 [Verrucomicrobia bacterium]|nr:hypothetical protein [Verrucomicrobiota bacterium]
MGLFESAKVNASGGAGGGEVLVGGDYLGKNPDVPHAKAVVMAPMAEIRADATAKGDGGKVILWSDDYTGFFGEITALGGKEGGNGGFVETSSKNNLQAFGVVHASAAKGLAGMWLMDPGSITIDSSGPTTPGGFSGANPLVFTAPTDPSVVLNRDITSALNQGTSVTIQTGTGAEYDISVNAAINKTLDNATTLKLEATGNITVGADITSIANELNMIFNADSNDSGAGSFNCNANLLSNGGNVTVTASGVALAGTINTLKTFQMPVTAIVGGTYGYDSITGIIGVPGVTVFAPTVPGGIAATATAVMGLQISSDPTTTIQITNGGSGYATVNANGKVSYQTPKVVISAASGDTTGAGATATAVVDTVVGSATFGQVTGIRVTQAGAGYKLAPQVTIQSTGGVGSGATASIDTTQGFEVVNLAFDGAGASVSVPSYGVGYTGAPFGVTFDSGTASATLGLSSVAGNVVIQPSILGGTVGVGLGTGSLSIDNGELNQITVTGTVKSGTITLGSRDAGALQVAGASVNGATNLELATGGTLQGIAGGQAVAMGTGLLTLNSAASITDTTGTGALIVDTARVAIKTEGSTINLQSQSTLTQLAVTTVGTTTTQTIEDGGNLTYKIRDNANGITTVYAPTFVASGSIDLFYENDNSTPETTSSLAGNIGVQANLQNVQAASLGVPSVLRNLELRAPYGNINTLTGVSIFTGGGNLTLASQTVNMGGANTLSTDIGTTAAGGPGTGLAGVTFASAYGVFNTFQSTGVGGTFGTSVAGANSGAANLGQVSGVGGVLTLEALSPSGAGREVYISENSALYPNAYTLRMYETMLLEAPAIRIGGAQAGNIQIDPLDVTRRPLYLIGAGATAPTEVTYLPRYFENPFYSGTVQIQAQTPTGVPGVSHVAGVSVSLVSGRGGVSNQPDGDINVTTFGMTGVDQAFFDGRGGANTTYAGTTSGSIIRQINGRTGRTVLDQTIGNGGDYSFYIGGGLTVVDGRTVTGGASSLSSSSAATASTTIIGGQVVSIVPGATGYQYNYDPVVTVYGGGIQEASARALVGSSGTVDRVVPQIIGLGYTSAPQVSISGGGGSGATATAFVNSLGQLSPFEVDSSPTYSYAPTIQIFGSGTGAVARPILSNGTSGTLTGVQIVDPGVGYVTSDGKSPISAIVLSGGGIPNSENQAQVRLASGFDPNSTGGQITPIYVSAVGSGYTSEPTITLSGGGIQVAQAKAMVDVNPGSNTLGQVIGYQITNPGQGYKTAPSVAVGQGQAFGNFGEYGISTEQVDQNRPSGNILVDNFGTVNNTTGTLSVNAPIRTGDALGVGGLNATSGSILLNVGAKVVANPDLQADGVLITGDASIVGSTGSYGNASSGSITITALGTENTSGSSLNKLTGSLGLPVQIGTATGGVNNAVGALNARATDRLVNVNGAGDLLLYAPGPGEIETAAGQPLDPNHPANVPRASNDLYLSGLQTDSTYTDNAGVTHSDESLVTVEVGAFEGKLTLLQYAPSAATATIGVTTTGQSNGQVTLITPSLGGSLYNGSPTVVITGGGIVQADGFASVAGGQVTSVSVSNAGSGYGDPPSVTFTGGGGSGASALATVANGVVTGITMTNLGYGYTSIPTVTLGPPAGTQATATATTANKQLGNPTGNVTVIGILAIDTIQVTNGGTGYLSPPPVTITDSSGFGFGATATAVISNGAVTAINVTSGGLGYLSPVITIGSPAGVATATANLTNGEITSYTITDPGAGYGSAPNVYLQTRADPYNLDVDKLLLAADRFSILPNAPSSVLVTASTAVVAPYTNQRPVDLGKVTTGSTSFLPADLQKFSVNDLVVGRREADQPSVGSGVLTISGAISSSALRIANGIVLAGTRQMADAGGSTGIAAPSLVMDAGGEVSLIGTGNQIHYFSGVIRDSGLVENASFTLSSSLTTSGSATLPLTIGEVFADAAFGTGQRFYQGITTQNGDIRIFADQLQQTRVVGFLDTTGGGVYGSGGLGANTAQVTLAPLTSGTGINLYATSPSSSSVLGLRVGNPQALGLELVESKGLVIGSGSLRDIQITDGGFGYQAPPTVTISGGGGSGATAQAILSDTGYFVNGETYYKVAGVRITNPGTGYTSAPTIEIADPVFGANTASATATTGAAGAITLNSNLEFNYLQYPNAPFQVTLASGSTGSITAGTSQATGGGLSRVRVGALTLFDAGAVSFGGGNDVDVLSAILTGSGTAANFSFADVDGIQLADLQVPGNLSIVAGKEISQAADTAANIGGTISLSSGSGGIKLETAGPMVLGNVTASSAGTLLLTSNGSMSQISGTSIKATGDATLKAVAGSIVLENSGNDFTGTLNLRNSGASVMPIV